MTDDVKACDRCGSTTGCPRDTGWPCTDKQVRDIERRAGYGGPGDYRSFWD
jgi:hypothetical protein